LGNAHRERAESVKTLTHGPKPPQNPDRLTWPDWPFILHTHAPHEEGGKREWNVGVTGFSGENDRVKKMHAVETERTPEGETKYLEGTEFEIECDLVLLAIGFEGPVHDKLLEDLNLAYDERGAIRVEDGYATCEPGIFVAGDAKRGASLIVWAIAEGREAARQADIFLTGRSLLSSVGDTGLG
jgi:glutamate synthase (NADPH/NADH) small chain